MIYDKSMLPVIFKMGRLEISSMGLMLVVAVLVGLFVAWKKARESHVEDKFFLDTAFMSLFWGLVGARVGYILINFSEFGFSLLRWLWLSNYVGLCWWSGLIAGAGYLWWRLKGSEEDVFLWLDYASLGLAAALPWGFLAVFLNGSYLGIETQSWWGVWFPGYEMKMVPIQLIMMFVSVVFFWWWWRMEGEYRTLSWYRAGRVAARTGFLWFGWLMFLGLSFALASLLRGDQTRVFGMALDLIMGLLLVGVSVVGIYKRSGRRFWEDISRLKRKKRREVTFKKQAGSVN